MQDSSNFKIFRHPPSRYNCGSMKFSRLMLILTLAVASSSVALVQDSAPPLPAELTAFVCPMHPDYTMDIAGKCPRCGMDLVRAAPFDVRDYRLDFRTVPAVVRPGQRTSLRFRIFH